MVTPKPMVDPAKGVWLMVNDASQLSVAVTSPVRSGTKASQDALAATVWSEAQEEMTGASVSSALTVIGDKLNRAPVETSISTL
jgi:hypothetical protein